MQTLTPAATSTSVMTEVIRVRGLTFTYPKATEPAVRGMDFSVGRGEIAPMPYRSSCRSPCR